MPCQPEYYTWCRNQDIFCHKCLCLSYYRPLPGGPHIPKDKTSAKNNRIGHRTERAVIQSIGGAITEGSGAIHPSDLDGWIKIGDNEYKIEHKTRIANRNVLGPTTQEWETMKKGGGSIFLTTHGDRTVVTIDIETFKEMLCSEHQNSEKPPTRS
jgi:hypothetical protein